jgi:hypothetical protein
MVAHNIWNKCNVKKECEPNQIEKMQWFVWPKFGPHQVRSYVSIVEAVSDPIKVYSTWVQIDPFPLSAKMISFCFLEARSSPHKHLAVYHTLVTRRQPLSRLKAKLQEKQKLHTNFMSPQSAQGCSTKILLTHNLTRLKCCSPIQWMWLSGLQSHKGWIGRSL